MYKADFNELVSLLGGERTTELQTFIDRVLKGKLIHHITGPNPTPQVVELIGRWMSIGQQLGITVTWERLWADKTFEDACNVLGQESLNQQFIWSEGLRQAYTEGFAYGKANLQKSLWDVDAVFIHEVCMLPLIADRNAARWYYMSHDYLGSAPREFHDRFKEHLSHFDAIVYPCASFVTAKQPLAHIWHPTVDILSPRNQDLDETEQSKIFQQTQLPVGEAFMAYVDRYDRLDHAEIVLNAYLKHPVKKQLSLVIAAESGVTNEEARRRVSALEHMAAGQARVYIKALPQNESFINVIRRQATVQLYWPKAGRTDTALVEALWAGTPVVAFEQLGIRDIVRPDVTALVAADINQVFDEALRAYTDKKLSKGLVERARIHTMDYALMDQELINLACLFTFKTADPMTLNWSLMA